MQLGGKDYDLDAALPFTLGDLRKLKKDGINFGSDLTEFKDPDTAAKLLLYLFRKIDGTVTEATVDSLTIPQMTEVAVYMAAKMQVADRPT